MAPTIDQLNDTIQDLTNDIRTLKVCQGNVPAVAFPTLDGGYDDKTLGEFLDRFYLYGSSLTFCRQSTATYLDTFVRRTNKGVAVAANGSRISFLGEFDAVMDYGNIRTTFTVLVSPGSDCPAPMVLGTDFMQAVAGSKTKVTLDFAKKTVSLGTEELAMLSGAIDLAPTPARVRLLEETVLELHSDNLLVAYVSPVEYKSSLIPSDPTSSDILLTAANHKYPAVIVGDVVADLDNAGRLPIRVINPGNSKVRIFNYSTLAHAEPVRDASPVIFDPSVAAVRTECSPTSTYTPPEANWTDKLPQEMPPIAVQLASKLNLDDSLLTLDARAKLKKIVMCHDKAFVANDGKIGKYNGPIAHRIDMEPGSAPFQLRPYRTPLALREEVQRQIEDMLRQGIIRPSASPFCSPIVMVKKADGKSWRFAVDYRKLNSLTVKQTYYLPLIQDILDRVGGKRYYSNFNFQSGFHQIPVFPPHVERTAFATFLGLFEFLRMPFGLCSAPSTFQRVMETMRKELTAAFFIYLDDVVLASDTEDMHLADIEQFLSVIEKYGMRLRLDKCSFGRAEIKYLGFLISEQGMRPDPKNITSIQSIKQPKNVTELRSFIGAVSYFRRFIPNFAGLMKPLYDLTKKESLTDWTNTHQQAFETVKQKLPEAPVLASPRFGQPFVVETDASATAIAACLLQENRLGEIHPVAYASRLLNKHEARYPSVESETLAIVFALREFAPYLEGAGTSTVRTDNSALSSLLQKKDLVGRLAKYQMTIQPFDIKIVHRSGGHAVNALTDTSDIPALTLENFREAQRDVLEYRILYDALVHDRWPAEEQHRRRVEQSALSYQVHNVTLHFVHPEDEDDIRRILVPYTLRTRLIRQFHSSLFEGAHLGTAKIQQKMKTRYYWPGMADDIAKVVTSCEICQKRKTASATVSHEPLHMIPVPRHPFDRVHVDFMGPLVTTPRKNRYIMVAVCAFSKWLIAVPTTDQTATTVSTAFINHVVTQHGVPSLVVTDQGRQFVGTIFNQLADRLHFQHVTTTPYHQQANVMVERQNQTLAAIIEAYAHKQKDEWDQFLPLDVERAMAQAWDAARTAMKASQAEHKRAAVLSRHAQEHNFHEHDLVLIYREAAPNEDRHKFRLRWEGPYRVIRVQRPNLIVRLLDEDAPLKEVHMDKAKPYKEDTALPLHALDIAPRHRPNDEQLQRAQAERELLRRHESLRREPHDANLEVDDDEDDDDNEGDPFPELDPLPEDNAANAPQPGPANHPQQAPARPPAGILRRRREAADDDPDFDASRRRYMPPPREPSTRRAAAAARQVWTNSNYL